MYIHPVPWSKNPVFSYSWRKLYQYWLLIVLVSQLLCYYIQVQTVITYVYHVSSPLSVFFIWLFTLGWFVCDSHCHTPLSMTIFIQIIHKFNTSSRIMIMLTFTEQEVGELRVVLFILCRLSIGGKRFIGRIYHSLITQVVWIYSLRGLMVSLPC